MSRVFLPRGLEEFFAARRDAPQAPLYAGGTDLLVRLRAQGGAPEKLICLERVAELTEIAEQDDTVFIGAAAPVQAVLDHPLVAERFGVLTQALSQLGSPPIRHMATLGGNLVTASPAGDSLPALYCLGAQVDIRWADGNRRASLGEFILGPGRVDLKAGEVVAGVILPTRPEWTLQHFEKVGKRKALAISVASLAACLRLDGDGLVLSARLAWGSVGPTVVTSRPVEQALEGKRLDQAALRAAADLAREAVSPIDDLRATASYRRAVAGNLLLRLAAA